MKREEAIKILQPIGEQYCEIANITLATRMDEIAEAIDMAIEALNAQLSQEGTTSDLISRQAAIDAIHNLYAIHGSEGSWIDQKDAFKALNSLPPAQPELAIPLSWIEKYIEWLKSLDNEFVNLAAAHISVMVKKWMDEQNEND